MDLITTDEAKVTLGISESDLMRAFFDRRIPRPRRVFVWTEKEFEDVKKSLKPIGVLRR